MKEVVKRRKGRNWRAFRSRNHSPPPSRPKCRTVHATPSGIGVNDLEGAHPDDDDDEADAGRIYNFLMLEIMPCYVDRQTHKSGTRNPNRFRAPVSLLLIRAIKSYSCHEH